MPHLDHVNILTRDPAPMLAFFTAVLDLREGHRPAFDSIGHWLYLDGQPVIHLNVVSRDADFPPGIINHVAFGGVEFHTAIARIAATGFRYEYRDIPGTDLGQVFVYGPEGLKLELQYPRPAASSAPPGR